MGVGSSTWKGFTSTGSAKGLVSKADMVIEGQRAISASATAFGHSDPAALSVNPPLPGARQPFWRRRSALCGGVALDVTEVRSAPAQPIRKRRLCILFPSTFFYSPEMLGIEPWASRMIDSAVALSDIPKPSVHLLFRCRISSDVFLPMCVYFELPNKERTGRKGPRSSKSWTKRTRVTCQTGVV